MPKTLANHTKKSLGYDVRLIGGHWLCADLIPRQGLVVDIGANRGTFSEAMVREFSARVVAVEPSPSMFSQLQEFPKMCKVNAAISDHQGRGSFFERRNSESSSLLIRPGGELLGTVEVNLITLPLLFERCGLDRVDVLKVDAEGAELRMFGPCTDKFLKGINQICIEFHEWFGVGTRKEVEAVIIRLRKAGFLSFSLVRGNYQAVLLVNRRLMSAWQYWATWLRIWIPRAFCFLLGKLRAFPPQTSLSKY